VAWCSLVLLTLVVGQGRAQQPTTVQLPTFSTFSSSSTVVVPDGGSVTMGSISRAASGRSEFGVPMLPFRPFRNTAIGSERSVSSLRVSATIHDFEAMDRFLLSQPTSFRALQAPQRVGMQQQASLPRPAAPATLAPATVAHRSDPRIGSSWELSTPRSEASAESRVAQIQAESQSRRGAAAAEAAEFFERGKQAEESGKLGVAKIYYRMATRQATDPLRSQATARLAAIARMENGPQVAQSGP